MGNGETYDFEFIAPAPGDLHFDITVGQGALLVSTPINVRKVAP